MSRSLQGFGKRSEPMIETSAIRRNWPILAGAGALLLLLLFFIAQHFLNADTYRGQIEASLSNSLGRPVQLGHLSFSLLSGSLVASAPSIADDPAFSREPFLTAKDIHLRVETGALLFHHQVHIRGLTINAPSIQLLRTENGTWNYSSMGGAKPANPNSGNVLPNLTVNVLEISRGTLSIGRVPAHTPPHVYTALNFSAQNFSLTAAFPFKASGTLPEGGSVTLAGTAGPINQRDTSLTPFSAQLSLKHADLLAAGLVEPGQGISGLADLEGRVISNGQTAQADGALHVTQLKLAKNGTPSAVPVDAQFSVAENLQALSGTITRADIQVGKAAMGLTGAYQTRGPSNTLQIRATGQNMPVDDLVAFLPSLGVQLPAGSRLHGGSLTLTLDIAGPVSAPVMAGPVRLAGSELAGFDLGQKLASIQAFTGAKTGGNTTIQELSTNLRYGPEGTRTDNLVAIVSGLGSASGSGEISPGGALNYHLVVKLSAGGVGSVATTALSMLPGAFGSTVSASSRNGIPLTISGTTSNPVFTPDVGKMVGGAVQKNPISNSLGSLLGGLVHK